MRLHIMHHHTNSPRRKQAAGTRKRSLVGDAQAVVDGCLGLNVRLAARRITGFLEARMKDAGLSVAQFGLMAHIAAARDDTIGGLAVRFGLDQSTLSRNLRTLERAGLVEIVIAEADLRRRAVWLTEQGALRLEATIPVWRSANAALSTMVGSRQVLRLVRSTSALTSVTEQGGAAEGRTRGPVIEPTVAHTVRRAGRGRSR